MGKLSPASLLLTGPLLQPTAAGRPPKGCSLHMGTCLVLGWGGGGKACPTRPPTEHDWHSQARAGRVSLSVCSLEMLWSNACLIPTLAMPMPKPLPGTEGSSSHRMRMGSGKPGRSQESRGGERTMRGATLGRWQQVRPHSSGGLKTEVRVPSSHQPSCTNAKTKCLRMSAVPTEH